MASGVYVIECASRQYVGSAQNISARWAVHRHHLQNGKHHSRYLQRAWDKHGENAFTFAVLEYCTSKECVEREQGWIDTLAPAYNMHPLARSPLGVKRSEETRAKLRLVAARRDPPMLGKHHSDETRAKLRGIKRTEETRAKLRSRTVSPETRAKQSMAKKGKPLTAEHRAHIGAARKGRKRSPETIEKTRQKLLGVRHSVERIAVNSAAHRGKTIPQAQREKISASLKGRPSPQRGTTVPVEQREKISAGLRAYNAANAENQGQKLNAAQVRAIRLALQRHETVGSLARLYEVSQTTISDIKAGRTWRNLKDE